MCPVASPTPKIVDAAHIADETTLETASCRSI
jgi:hypothetical protein